MERVHPQTAALPRLRFAALTTHHPFVGTANVARAVPEKSAWRAKHPILAPHPITTECSSIIPGASSRPIVIT